MTRFFILLSLTVNLVSCFSPTKQKSEGHLTFDKVTKLIPEVYTQSSVQSLLGPADLIIELPNSDDIAWIYKEESTGHQKLSLVFNNEEKLQSVLWHVSDRDPEIDLEHSKKRFPNAKFVVEEVPWDNPHAAPREKVYVDIERGVSISFQKTREEVESISWYIPKNSGTSNRKPASKYSL